MADLPSNYRARIREATSAHMKDLDLEIEPTYT